MVQSNPFGAAKPREAVLSQRTGVDEKEILKSEAQKYARNVRPPAPLLRNPSRALPTPIHPTPIPLPPFPSP
jgi:hypothetical protein